MEIERVYLYHLRMPLVEPFETSFGQITTRDCIIVELISEGISGFGECVADKDPGYSYETSGTAWHIMGEFIVPKILGVDVDPFIYSEKIKAISGHPMAKAGVELAIWDLAGKLNNWSLKEKLGGIRAKVPVGVSVGIQETPRKLVERVARYLEEGYRRVKIKIKPGRDIGDVDELRKEFPHIMLQVDANSAYDVSQIEHLLKLDSYNLLLVEQPFAQDDFWYHAKLSANMTTPVCLDESILSLRHAKYADEMGACQVINIKVGRVGGLLESLRIHDYCLKNQIPVWCGGMLETGIGRAANLALASLPGFKYPGDISATSRYYKVDITEETFSLNSDSTIDVPDSKGLGVTVNRDVLRTYCIRTEEFAV